MKVKAPRIFQDGGRWFIETKTTKGDFVSTCDKNKSVAWKKHFKQLDALAAKYEALASGKLDYGHILFKGKKFKITEWVKAPRGFMGYVKIGKNWGADIPHPRRPKLMVYNRIGKKLGFGSYIKPLTSQPI
jgi:hypothetical protein